MRKVTIGDLDPPTATSPASVRLLGDELGTTDLSINYFELAPGEQFGFDFHRHLDQEEVFYVQEGVATFETETGAVEVAAGETIRFAPGEFQLGRNLGDTKVVALALGAPKGTEQIEYLRLCPACGERTTQTAELVGDDPRLRLTCQRCDGLVAEFDL